MLEKKIYSIYILSKHDAISLSFNEFKTFSLLLCNVFDEYNPLLLRERDVHPFEEDDDDINRIINDTSYEFYHSNHPDAFEIDATRLKILLEVLNSRKEQLKENLFSEMSFEEELVDECIAPVGHNKEKNQYIKEIIRRNNKL